MSRFPATYYDGRSSARQPVEIEIGLDERLLIHGLDQRIEVPLREVSISEPLGRTPRCIRLPGGATLEVPDSPELAGRLAPRDSRLYSLVHWLESRWPAVIVSLAGVVALTWLLITAGIPAAARHAANALPPSVDRALGREGMRLLDELLFDPSRLAATRRGELRALFDTVAADAPEQFAPRLLLRRSEELGANAFALPSGIVVLTDDIVELAASDEELIAVMAHEIGHVIHRHALRALLQNSAAVALIIALTGDVSSASALAASIPTLIVQSAYSQRFEIEADAYACDFLARHDIPPQRLNDLLSRLDRQAGDDGERRDYLSTHPPTGERRC